MSDRSHVRIPVYRSVAEVPAGFGPCVASIGNFDGVHLGHREILSAAATEARSRGFRSIAITFDPHPAQFLYPAEAPKLLTFLPERLRLLATTGVDAVLVLPFDGALSRVSARDFVRDILVKSLGVRGMHEGSSFRFGHGAKAGVEELKAFGAEFGFAVEVHRAVRVHGITVRLAQLVLLAGLIAWWRSNKTGLPANSRTLLIAWAPFLGIFLLASMLSADPLPGLVKLCWFGFNFLGAYAWCQLFRREDLVLGYFSAYLVVAAVIVFDFYIGFGTGPAHMIGYAQPTYGVPGREGWFRPHAFYYEPSYAAAALGLAWALALTTVSVYAPRASAALAMTAITALAVTFSRTGWITDQLASTISWRV